MAVTGISIASGGFNDGTGGAKTNLEIGDNIKGTTITSIEPTAFLAAYDLFNGETKLATVFNVNGVVYI